MYLTVLSGCLVFYLCYKQWLAWVMLLCVAALPWLSLALSLPAMRSVTARLRCPETVRKDMPLRTALELTCKYPSPPVDCRIRLHNTLTDQRYIGHPGERIPTRRCGMMQISYARLWVYDYLGLFRRKLDRSDQCRVYIMPKALEPDVLPKKENGIANLWRPKPGGGFSEEHDLRIYRPGDDLRQIHWKMTAKTGKLIYREPVEPVLQGYVVTLALSGTAEEIESKLGRLLGLGEDLLKQDLQYSVRCVTGEGLREYDVCDRAAQEAMLRGLLASKPAMVDRQYRDPSALWQHHIGGDSR